MNTTLHDLKILPDFFYDVMHGLKDFEVRKNDRDFAVGDQVLLREYSDQRGFTGRMLHRRIKYRLLGGQYGVAKDYVVLGLEKI